MRDQPTPAEEQCAQALAEAFRNEGHTVVFPDRDRKDKPDILIEVAGVLVACECTQIPPSYIYQFQHKKYNKNEWPDGEILSTTWPNEPHEWIANAITKKLPLVPDYLARTGAKEAWLLIHTPPEDNQFFIDSNKEWIQWALRHGSKMHDHLFRQIHLWTPQGGIYPVSVLKDETNTHSELGIELSNGYPTICVNRMSFVFTTTRIKDDPPNLYEYNFNTRASKRVEPKDKAYAKHNPATRDATYKYKVLVWNDRAEISSTVIFNEPEEVCELDPIFMNKLLPSKDYWHHVLHEFRAPKTLHTLHRVQPYD